MLLRAAALTRTRALSMRASAIWMAVLSAVLALAGPSDGLAARKPVLSVRDVVAKEASGAAAVKFVLARPTHRAVRFTVTPARGTAQRADASFARRRAVIRRGRRSTVVRIPLRNDALNENTEDFFVTVSGVLRSDRLKLAERCSPVDREVRACAAGHLEVSLQDRRPLARLDFLEENRLAPSVPATSGDRCGVRGP